MVAFDKQKIESCDLGLGVIQCLAISPDEHYVVSASSDKVIKFWDCCFVSSAIELKKQELRNLLQKGQDLQMFFTTTLADQRKNLQIGGNTS